MGIDTNLIPVYNKDTKLVSKRKVGRYEMFYVANIRKTRR